ncbi:MAG: hypothetical protein E6J91_35125 [Deltaproteobacteria bacterium]|nr:MAG: hypothetical protein E6J91_35125 [Deltaproteobacteria bacterium]
MIGEVRLDHGERTRRVAAQLVEPGEVGAGRRTLLDHAHEERLGVVEALQLGQRLSEPQLVHHVRRQAAALAEARLGLGVSPAQVGGAPAPVSHVARARKPLDEPAREQLCVLATPAAHQELQLEGARLQRQGRLVLEVDEDRRGLRQLAVAQRAPHVLRQGGDETSRHGGAAYDTKL